MGIHCEINLFKPTNEVFTPGSTVAGVIKYAVDEETVFKMITVSLKGKGDLRIKDKQRRRRNKRSVYRNSEDYVDIDNIVHENEQGIPFSIGSYETRFSFQLPKNIPSSLEYFENIPRYVVRCSIAYYIRIKFDRPGIFKFAKHFRKCLKVVSGITPRLPMVPTIYGQQKKLFQMFSSKNSILNLKANIEKSVIAPGGKIELNYEAFNDTNVIVKGIETKLIEVWTYTTSGGREVKICNDVENTDTKTGSINCGDTQSMPIEINVPSNKCSLDHSKIASRDYFVKITVELPLPHFNAILEIPVQVGNTIEEVAEVFDDPPPSYWEVMGLDEKEDKKEEVDANDSSSDEST